MQRRTAVTTSTGGAAGPTPAATARPGAPSPATGASPPLTEEQARNLASRLWPELRKLIVTARMDLLRALNDDEAGEVAGRLWPETRDRVVAARMEILDALDRRQHDVLGRSLFPAMRRYLNADLMGSRIRSGHVIDGRG